MPNSTGMFTPTLPKDVFVESHPESPIAQEIIKQEQAASEQAQSNWNDVYNSLDKENQRALWRNLIKEIKLDKEFKIKVDFL